MYYTYLIIDSDATSSVKLMHYLDDYPECELVGRCLDASEGINNILKYDPDLVIMNLDEEAVQIFGMVKELHQYLEELPILIGVSKTTDKAYEAIKNNFFDYWLLPCNEYDIRKTVLKLKRRTPKNGEPQKLCLKTYRDYHYINTADILYLKAKNNATQVFMVDGSELNTYKSLKSFEQQLPANFVRVHQSYILNTKYVARINYGKAVCSLKGQKLQLPFSKTYKGNVDALKSKLSKNAISTRM